MIGKKIYQFLIIANVLYWILFYIFMNSFSA